MLTSQKRNKLFHLSSTDSESDVHKSTPMKSYRLRKGEEILSAMWDNVNNEEAYDHYFNQLLGLEGITKDDETDLTSNFNVEPYIKLADSHKVCMTKNSQSQKTNPNLFPEHRRKSTNTSKNRLSEELIVNVSFLVDLDERMRQRKQMVEGYLMYCDDLNMFQSFVDRLVSFEEGLIQQ